MTQTTNDVVVDKAESKLSDLWTKEDYWAIWLGFFILAIAFFAFAGADSREKLAAEIAPFQATIAKEAEKPFKSVGWYKATAKKNSFTVSSNDMGKLFSHYLGKPKDWSDNFMASFVRDEAAAKVASEKAAEKFEAAKAKTATALEAAQAAEQAAATGEFKDAALNEKAGAAATAWNKATQAEGKAKSAANAKPYNLLMTLPVLMVVLGAMFSVGAFFMGKSVPKFFIGFCFVFLLAVLAQSLGGQAQMKYWGVGAEAWAIILGMIIANTVGTPNMFKGGLEVEYFIKTGLVLLGAEVLMSKILAIGIPGIFVAWVVTPIVLVSTYIFGQKVLKMESKTLNITISADMSVCGTSAAIATAAACRAKKEELTLAVGLSLTFTAIMMIAMPAFIKAVGMHDVLGGAWIGGTVDSTGAVTAAGAFLGERAMAVAATIKMIQNVLIGVTAFCVAVYWATKVDRVEGQKVSPMEIWHRFPKFVLGFLGASIIFSSLSSSLGPDLGDAIVDQGIIKGLSGGLRGWFFVLAFTSIGLATNFRELAKYFKGGKPVILYVCGQSFNLLLTLIMAYIMFYKVFPEITASL
ncbi:YeiH family protein [Desulfovibrio cuneatus]|uniref:YeiH family protein n=1 Tax=Desulfovibrio cuneatus TaxID=159728 RepID=UPI0004022BB6|nr:putative sulfate exporter family transporter [Desulfovibrio cuneatus]